MATIRRAEPEDAEDIAALLIRSIRELCGPDYGNDEAILVPWCANKTPEKIRNGILNPNNYWIVALEGGIVTGTALMTLQAEIHLCYLLPEYLHRGIGKAMLDDVIGKAVELGFQTIKLESTRTAREFYLHNGFIMMNEVMSFGRIPCFAMKYDLTRAYA